MVIKSVKYILVQVKKTSYKYLAATTSEVTRGGKTTFIGKVSHKVASLERLYNSKFEDRNKSELYSILIHGMKNLDKTD